MFEYGLLLFFWVLVYDKNGDDIIGFVYKNDIMLVYYCLGEDYKISKLVKLIYIVLEILYVLMLFEILLLGWIYICLVVDEYGDV